MKLFSKKSSPKARQKGRGALAILATLLVGSAILRVGIGATEALARDDGAETVIEAAAPAPGKPAGQQDADIEAVLRALQTREARLDAREEQLEIRLKALMLAEEEIEKKLEALQTAEANLRSTLALARDAAKEDIDQLTSVYANMKPKQAAALFETMDPDFAAGFLSRMRPDAAAAIMAGLSAEVAYTISVVLAGRNANVPKE